MSKDSNDDDKQVEIWKIKKLIKTLREARGYVISTPTIH